MIWQFRNVNFLREGILISGDLTQDVSKCENILEMKKIDFSRSLPIGKSTRMTKNGD